MDDLDNITVAVKRRKLGHRNSLAKVISPRSLSPNSFDKLPVEINQNIASFLEYDQDICNFQLVCRSTRDAVEENNGTFWRRRFLTKFEKPNWTQMHNSKFRSQYQKRRFLLKNGAMFKSGNTSRERQCLEVLADLVAESYSSKIEPSIYVYECKNMEHILRFLRANNLLQIIGQLPRQCSNFPTSARKKRKGNSTVPEPVRVTNTALLQAIQIVAAPMLLSFDTHIVSHHLGFPDSQRAVYSTSIENPLFGGRDGLDINMSFVLHNLNFWKYHMIRDVETTLYYPFSDLDAHDRPQWWTGQPKRGEKKLATFWKGSYAYIERDEIDGMRSGHAEALEIQDHFAGEDTAFDFQDMKLSLIPEASAPPWPEIFERHLHARNPRPPPSGPRTRAQQRCAVADATTNQRSLSFRFDGEGSDVDEAFLASGWLNSLPAQHGIPGWQRVTMMKYFEDDYENIDLDALWAYEGVMLPGGKIMLGRWWSVADEMAEREEMYSGPFILWAVNEVA